MAVPVNVPAVAGAKITPKEVVCPAASVSGSVMVVGLNPVPVTPILEIVTLEFPVFETVTVCVDELPSVRLPKLRAAGEADSCSTGAVLLPESGTVTCDVGELFMMVRFAK